MKRLMIPMLFLALLALWSGCSMGPNRSYSDEMERETDGLWIPSRDFRVVSGDEGAASWTRQELRDRTPASESEKARYREERSLEDELASLEGALSEAEMAHYVRYSDRLGTTSNRIYFLKIPTIPERNTYLKDLGVVTSNSVAKRYISSEEGLALQNHDILLGMSKDAVSRAWGRPDRVDMAGNASMENERWSYFQNGRMQYVYFEGGKVQGWNRNGE